MRTHPCVLLLAAALAGCATAQTESMPSPAPPTDAAAAISSAAQALPPLIPRERFFGDPEITNAQLSPDGRFIAFVRPLDGVRNVWVKGIDEPFAAARPVTADSVRPVNGYFWSRDGRYVLFVQDRGGDENFHVYGVDPAAPAAVGSRVPPARDLTPYPGVRALIYAVPERTPGKILVGLNDRNPRLHDVYRVDLASGERELVFRNDENVGDWTFDLEGELRLGSRQTESGTEILRVDGQRLTPIYTCNDEETCGLLRFHRDGRRVYLETNQGEPDLTGLVLPDPQTGQTELVERDPEGKVDFGGTEFSDATEELVATYYVGDRLRVYPKDASFAGDYEIVRAALPDGEVRFGSSTSDDRLHLVSVTSDVDPGATYLYDRSSGKVDLLYRVRPELQSAALAPMRPIRYKARDGVEIPAYLTVPKGVEPRNLPTIVYPHGGPWARDTWGYEGIAQFLANRGYAVLQPNFRGSTGYGERFLNLGNREWGTGSMQHDLSDAVAWLVEQGIADPARVGILGGSYGGYATLAGVTFTPELYAAGVDIVGPSNLITLYNSFPAYWAPVVLKLFDKRMGDPNDLQDRKMLEAQSPLFFADRIQAPLLVIQGANDPRVVKPESDQIVAKLHELGRPVEYLVAPDEGHGFAGEVNGLAMFAAIERFLAEHLGGRYQEEMAPAVRERLRKLTVDPASVQVPERKAATPSGR